MSNFIQLKSFKITAVAAALALAGCGGGSVDSIAPQPDIGIQNPSNGGNTGGNTGGGGTTTPSNPTPSDPVKISETIILEDNSGATRVVTNDGATAYVKVTDDKGDAVSGALVTFSSNGGVQFSTSNGSVLTNSKGEARIGLTPLNSSDTGAYSLSATVSYNGGSATTLPYNFSLQALNILLSDPVIANPNLESGESTLITLTTTDADTGQAKNDVAVNFSTSCGKFTQTSVTSSSQGNISNTYYPIDNNGNLCEGDQTITSSLASGQASKVSSVTIAASAASSIEYTTTESIQLGIKSSGSSSSREVEFTVYSKGTPVGNNPVIIELVKAPEGVSLDAVTAGTNQPTVTKQVVSDSSGKVNVSLFPGNKPGPVEVKVSLADTPSTYALSKNISVASGRVSQDGLSISASKWALDTSMDGDSTTITARMVDGERNPVPDGTTINFVSEGGMVDPSCATVNGQCSVTLTTQNPRPSNGRVSVLAYVEGDKQYIDSDGDNVYTKGKDKIVDNIGDFFRDDNENNKYDEGEFKYMRGDKGACAPKVTKNKPSALWQPNIDGTCNEDLDGIIREQLVFAFSDNTPTYVAVENIDISDRSIVAGAGVFSFKIFGNSSLSVPMPSGTTISVSAVDNTDNNNASCGAELRNGYPTTPSTFDIWSKTFNSKAQFDTKDQGAEDQLMTYAVKLKDCAANDEVSITVASPTATTTSYFTIK